MLPAMWLSAQQYNFIRYSVAEGLPQSQVFSTFHDSKGYIWFGTQGGGLSRFDGEDFENYSTKDGLPSNYVQAIFEVQGAIWAGTQEGLCFFEGQGFQEVKLDDPQENRANAFSLQGDSSLWIGTNRGIFQYNPSRGIAEKVNLHPLLDELTVFSFFQGRNGLWVATQNGAWLIGADVFHLDSKQGLAGNDVRTFTYGPNAQLWIISFTGGITVLDEESLRPTAYINNEFLRRSQCVYTDPEGSIWVGTQDRGVARYSPADSTWIQITEEQGLPHNHVRSILSDRWGNTWIATSGGGMAKYLGQFFVHFNRNNGLNGNRVYALCEDQDNKLWLSISSNGLSYYDSLGFAPMLRDSGFLDVRAKTIFEDSESRLWIGTEGKGVALFDSTGMRRITSEDGLPSGWIRKIVEDTSGNIWVATHASGIGLIRQIDTSGVSIETIGRRQGLTDPIITTLKQDPQKKIWFGTRSGKVGLFNSTYVANTFGEDSGLPGTSIRSIAFNKQDQIWVGTANGVYYATLGKDSLVFSSLEAPWELYSQNIYLLIFDPDGNLWAGSERGVDKIFFNASGVIVDIQHFGPNEGFLGIETCQDAALTDHRGHLWFGTMNGLTRHIPSARSIQVAPPQIHFRGVSLFYQPLKETEFASWAIPSGGIKKGLSLPYKQNHLGFEFKAINLSDPQNIQYRWKLDGTEADWSPLSENESVHYSNLPPGDYSFSVQACSGEDNCSEPISASFSIQKPFWQLAWFRVSTLIFTLGLIGGIFGIRIRSIRRRERAKREQLEVANRLLQLEQKALQLQMNPHFIFNALNSIQFLVSKKDFQTARQEIGQFAKLMRVILSNSRKQEISLKEEIDTLERYLRMEQFCQRVDFDFDIQVDPNIDPDEISIPPMLIQPYVENAVIHGVSHLPEKGHIDIRFSLKEELLECEIKDNGVGRKRAAELRQSHSPGHQSTAMQVTEERLSALLAGQQVKPLQIEDLYHSDGTAAGTRVLVWIPAEVHF